MNFKNLKINFLGDSITFGVGASCQENCYVKLVEMNTGAVCRNYGLSGTRIARQQMLNPHNDRCFCLRIDEMDADADVIVVFGGTNDFGHGNAPIGIASDRTPETFYGALHYLYENLIKRYPDAFIFVITPLHRSDENNPKGDGSKETESLVLREYVQIIREVADSYSLPILDLFADSGIQPDIEEHRYRYTTDGLHPNDRGHSVIAKRIINFIEMRIVN